MREKYSNVGGMAVHVLGIRALKGMPLPHAAFYNWKFQTWGKTAFQLCGVYFLHVRDKRCGSSSGFVNFVGTQVVHEGLWLIEEGSDYKRIPLKSIRFVSTTIWTLSLYEIHQVRVDHHMDIKFVSLSYAAAQAQLMWKKKRG